MVRTYRVNALTQSDNNVHSVKNMNRERQPPQDPIPTTNKENSPNVQSVTANPETPFVTQPFSYPIPTLFHSPFVDPVGSIVGLRVVYVEGKICYVPVEPQVNYLINQQFGPPCGANYYPAPIPVFSEWSQQALPLQSISPPTDQSIPQNMSSIPAYTSQTFQPFMNQGGQSISYPQPVNPTAVAHQSYQQPPTNQSYHQPTTQTTFQTMGNNPGRVESPYRNNQAVVANNNNNNSYTNNMNSGNNTSQQQARQPVRAMNDWFPSNPQPKSGVRRSREWRGNVDQDYNPWGKGGGGSPLKDDFGNLIADRRKLGKSWKSQIPTNQPHHLDSDKFGHPYRNGYIPYSTYAYPTFDDSSSYLSGSSNRSSSFAPITSISTSMPNLNRRGISDAEQHKMELQRQIEDNKRRKEMEKQREKELEDREIRKHEAYMERIKREEEEEKKRAREKAQAADARRAQIHAEQQMQARQIRRRSPPPREPSRDRQRVSSASSVAPRQQEWWEKKPTWQQRQQDEDARSVVIPTLRGKPPQPPRTPSANGRSVSRNSRAAYDPSSSISEHIQEAEREEREASARSQRMSRQQSVSRSSEGRRTPTELSESMRRMSATEASLVAEQDRVKSALSNNNYGEHVFNDDHGRPMAFTIK